MNKRNLIPIREYESFVSDREAAGCITLPEHAFEQLEKFLLLNRGRGDDALELMGPVGPHRDWQNDHRKKLHRPHRNE